MDTDTMTTPEAPARTWTMAQVEADVRRAEDLEATLAKSRDEERRLGIAIAEAYASDDAEQKDILRWTAQRREAGELAADIEAALPVLRQRIVERRESALRGEAEKRLLAISRAHGSARASYAQDAERFASAVAAMEDAARKLSERYETLLRLEAEVLVLLDRFEGIAPPSIERVVTPAKHSGAHAAMLRARSLTLPDPSRLPGRLLDVPGRAAGRIVGMAKGSPGWDILQQAGGWDREGHDARHEGAKVAGREGASATLAEEHARLVGWLREQLEAGPVRTDVLKELGRLAGWNWRRPLSTSDTVDHVLNSLGAFYVVREDDAAGAWYWTLGRADGFELPAEGQRLTGSLR